jgi:hypothetical protein
MNSRPLRDPSGWLPVVMSLAGLAMVLLHFARFGIVHEADEGTEAHLFQILMVAQVPIVIFFALKWVPRAPREAMIVLALQAAAGIAAFSAVYFLT